MTNEPIPKAAGIYRIVHVLSGKFYVGSAVNLRQRWRDHRAKLRAGKHRNAKLQHAWNKYGEGAFKLEVVEILSDRAGLIQAEQRWIDALQPFGDAGYNLAPAASSLLGFKHSDATKKKLSDARKGKLPQPDAAERLRAFNKDRKLSPETRARIGAALRGRQRNPESVEKSAAAHRGVKRSDEARARMSEANKAKAKSNWSGRRHTEESKARMSEARRGKGKGRKPTTEQLQRMAEGRARYWDRVRSGEIVREAI